MPDEKHKREELGAKCESSDVNSCGVAWNGVALAVMLAALFLGIRGLYGVFSRQNSGSPLAAQPNIIANPRLQVDEERDLARQREQETLTLHTYGWVDHKAGIVRIPIERAMEIVAQQGLPTPSAGPGKTRLDLRQEKAPK